MRELKGKTVAKIDQPATAPISQTEDGEVTKAESIKAGKVSWLLFFHLISFPFQCILLLHTEKHRMNYTTVHAVWIYGNTVQMNGEQKLD